MKLIGLDIGTTGICGIRLDAVTGNVEESITENRDVWIKSQDSFARMQNPQKITDIVYDILKRLDTGNISAIGVTGQMHGIVYINGDGVAVSPLYTWQDERGNEIYNGNKTYAEHLNSHAGYGNVTHFYNLQNGLIPKDAVCFCTIHDYIAMKLCNLKVPKIHISDAASFGNFDIEHNKFTLKNEFLPQFTDKCEFLGKYGDIPVSVAIGDNQAGFIGCGNDENSVLFNVGTGSQISFLTEVKKTDVSGIEIRPLTNGRYIAVGSSLCGGRAYDLLEHFFGSIAKTVDTTTDKMYDIMTDLANQKECTDLLFSTLFCGTRDDPRKRAEIKNLSESNFTPTDFILACLNGIADELFSLYLPFGKKTERLIGSGNAVRKNPALIKAAEKRFNCKMLLPKFSEEAACGAAIFAYAALENKDVLKINKIGFDKNDL